MPREHLMLRISSSISQRAALVHGGDPARRACFSICDGGGNRKRFDAIARLTDLHIYQAQSERQRLSPEFLTGHPVRTDQGRDHVTSRSRLLSRRAVCGLKCITCGVSMLMPPIELTEARAIAMIKRLESAQRRHITAIKQYHQIKKLLPHANNQPDLKIFRPRQGTA